jgi:hypothetical protein
MKKENKKTAVFYNEQLHHSEMSQAHESMQTFKRAKNNLEAITNKPIKDFEAFRKDILGYSMQSIKETFPKPFELGLTDEATLKMLSIDLKQLTQDDAFLSTTPFKFCVCSKTGETTPDECKENYIWYATTEEQHQRLDFANELSNILERAYLFTPHTFKSNVTNGLTHIVYFDVQTETIKPNHFFVMNGIK